MTFPYFYCFISISGTDEPNVGRNISAPMVEEQDYIEANNVFELIARDQQEQQPNEELPHVYAVITTDQQSIDNHSRGNHNLSPE